MKKAENRPRRFHLLCGFWGLLYLAAIIVSISALDQASVLPELADLPEDEAEIESQAEDRENMTEVTLVQIAPEQAEKRPKPKRVPATRPQRPSKKSPPPSPTPYETHYEEALVQTGERLLELTGKDRFPPIRASYSAIGLDRYMREVAFRGGRFFVGDWTTERILASIDPFLKELEIGVTYFEPSEYAMDRQRMIRSAGESSTVNRYLTAAGVSFGQGDYHVVLFLERWFDALIVGSVDQCLKKIGMKYQGFEEFQAEYRTDRKGALILHIFSGTCSSGDNIPMNFTVGFDETAHPGPGAAGTGHTTAGSEKGGNLSG